MAPRTAADAAAAVEAWGRTHHEIGRLRSEGMLVGDGRCPVAPLQRVPMLPHPLHRVSSFERVGAYTLRVEFADGSQQIIDFTPVLVGEMYGPLQNPDLFGQVRVDAEVHTLVWPNGQTLIPRLFTTGPSSWKNSQPGRAAGLQRRPSAEIVA